MRDSSHLALAAVVAAILILSCPLAPAYPGEGCCPGSPYGNGTTECVYATNYSLTGNLDCHNLTVNPGVTLDTRGYTVRVCGTLLNWGTITDTRCGGSHGNGGAGGDGQDPCGEPAFPENGVCGTPGGGPTCSGGGAGGDGGGGGGGGGGAKWTIVGCVDANGGDGGSGGAGGNGGGRVKIYAYRLDNRGAIHADGHNGSSGSSGTNGEYFSWGVPSKDMCGGGGGGGAGGNGGDGGTVEIYYGHLLNQGTIHANGGQGGAGGSGGLSGCYREGHGLYWGALASEYDGGIGCPDIPAHPRGGDGGWGERHQDLWGENGYPGDAGLPGTPGQWNLYPSDPDPCPDPTGACCYYDGSCSVTTQLACAGTWLGAGTTCSPNPCPQPGACCYPDGCDFVIQQQCAGDWLGEGTPCEPDPCIYGACCVDETCTYVLEQNCNGDWLGENTYCDPNPCIPGACCYPDESCDFGRQDQCTGQWLGVGTSCDPNPCLLGACCLTVRIDQQCSAVGGGRNISAFAPMGQEFIPTVSECLRVDLYLWNWSRGPITVNIHEGTIYGPVVPGATVVLTPDHEGWVAFQFASAISLSPGATYVIEASSTSSWGWAFASPSAYPSGRAILSGSPSAQSDQCFRTIVSAEGDCELLIQSACVASEGEWRGDGTDCDPNPCLSAWCLGDMNCAGGAPTFDDIKYFAAAIGSESGWWKYYHDHNDGVDPPCPWLLGDYQCPRNGVGFEDIKPFAASIGQPCIAYAPCP